MLVEEQKLRWCGIDMRARWRRRMAVVVTYAVFLVIVGSPTDRVYGPVVALFWISLVFPVWSGLEDVEVWMRWAMKGITLLLAGFFLCLGWDAWLHPHKGFVTAGVFASVLLWSKSVVGLGGGLVDHGRPNWMAEAIRNGGELSWRKQRRLARKGFGIGLDGFAWYEYGMRFQRLDDPQKAEIEAMRLAHPRGKWMRKQASVLFDDERLKNEEARLRARVQKVLSWVLVGAAFVVSFVLADGGAVSARLVVASLWTLAGMVTTLRQAMVLWGEEDPREGVGEMAVVGGVVG